MDDAREKRFAKKNHDAAWKSVDENDLIDVKAIAKTLPNVKEVLAYRRIKNEADNT